jgi:hypothetical protein
MNIRTMYLRDETHHPVGCVVTLLSPDHKTVAYQLTGRHPQDAYDRKVGRNLAIGRLITDPIILSLEESEVKRYNIVRVVLLDIVSNSIKFPVAKEVQRAVGVPFHGFPRRIGKAADEWLTAHSHGLVSLELDPESVMASR